jgi:choline dehydrogenase-like flavoprotein
VTGEECCGDSRVVVLIFVDFAEGGQDVVLEADLCVIGAGAAGLTLVHELRRSALRICVIETGGLDRDAAADELSDAASHGSTTLDFIATRPRAFGGSTVEWGGMCCPLDECDFETRPSMPLHGWPVSLTDLQPYYQRAHTALGLGPRYFDERLWSVLGIPPPEVDPRRLQTKFWQYRSPRRLPPHSPLRFGQAYRNDVASSDTVKAVLNATVVKIVRAPGRDAVERVEFRSIAGRRGQVRANVFVLAGGAVENARQLLASDFSGCSEALGRYFMEHPHVSVGRLAHDDTRRLLPKWAVLQRSGQVSFRPKFLPTRDYQRERDILNASLTLEVRCGPDCPHRALADFARGVREKRRGAELARAAGRVVVHSGVLAGAAYRRSVGRPACPGHGGLVLYCRSEQEPNPASRVVLGQERDALGINRAEVSWRLTDRDRRTAVDFGNVVGSELRRLGARNLTMDGWLDEPDGWPADMVGGPHHSGTTRMSDSAATGVVDKNSRVYGVPNLYVLGSSVFPTGGYANPTYTIVALAIRAADHLQAQLRGGVPTHAWQGTVPARPVPDLQPGREPDLDTGSAAPAPTP